MPYARSAMRHGLPRVVWAPTFRRLCRARDFVHAHYGDTIDLDDLAAVAGLSRFHFQRSFTAVFGMTPHQYVTKVRLDRARELLGERGSSVTETCIEVGFASIGSFSTLFRRHLGLSPRDYQRRVRRVVSVPTDLPLLRIPHCFAAFWLPID
jgi:AraC-like DNA-binding protein